MSYRLCDQNFQCEQCSLDKAIRQPWQAHPASAVSGPVVQTGEIDILHSLRQLSYNPQARYGRSFWCLETTAEGTVHISLNETAVKLLPDVLEVMIPCCDAAVLQDQPVFHFKTQQGSLTLPSPLQGMVADVNRELLSDLRRRKKGIAGPVRLLTMRLSEREETTDKWLSGEPAVEFLQHQQQSVLDRFMHELYSTGAALGPTSNDGGVQIDDLESALGAVRYFQLIRELFKES